MKRSEKKKQSRNKTGKILRGSEGMTKYEIKDKFCKSCGKKQDLEAHHEAYPISAYKIRKAIHDGKIYYLCKKCHKIKHTQNKYI